MASQASLYRFVAVGRHGSSCTADAIARFVPSRGAAFVAQAGVSRRVLVPRLVLLAAACHRYLMVFQARTFAAVSHSAANYVFKPTAESLRFQSNFAAGGGLTQR